MQAPPIPANEAERLAALYRLLILDTPPEERYDRIVRFAADEFDVPIALITLLDRERLWFKANVGAAICETERGISFCGHTILQDTPFLVPDTLDDARFVDNPFVTGDTAVRFYAGMPLVLAGGERVGALCLLDRRPRSLDAMEVGILSTLRDLVVMELSEPGGVAHA